MHGKHCGIQVHAENKATRRHLLAEAASESWTSFSSCESTLQSAYDAVRPGRAQALHALRAKEASSAEQQRTSKADSPNSSVEATVSAAAEVPAVDLMHSNQPESDKENAGAGSNPVYRIGKQKQTQQHGQPVKKYKLRKRAD